MTERITDAQLASLEAALRKERRGSVEVDDQGDSEMLLSVAVELRAARALIAALKAEGCPWREDCGDFKCAYCGGRDTKGIGGLDLGIVEPSREEGLPVGVGLAVGASVGVPVGSSTAGRGVGSVGSTRTEPPPGRVITQAGAAIRDSSRIRRRTW